jgi:hypothetical protein
MKRVENNTMSLVDDEDGIVEMVLTDDDCNEDSSHNGKTASSNEVTDSARSSPVGGDAPLTHNPILWEKPSWTKQSMLSPTRRPKESVGNAIGWQKPEWAASPTKLRSTDSGKVMTAKGDLQKAITHVEKKHLDDINFEANPLLLMPTEKGYSLRLGDNLAGYVSRARVDIFKLCVCVPIERPSPFLCDGTVGPSLSFLLTSYSPKQTYHPYRKESNGRYQLRSESDFCSTRYRSRQ